MDIEEQLRQEWERFKVANDELRQEIARNGQASAETTAKVDRINDAITALQAQLAEQNDANDRRIEDIENRLNRSQIGAGRLGRIDDEQRVRYAAWQSGLQHRRIDPADVDLELIRNYTRAFDAYVRTGDTRLFNEMSVGSDPDGGYLVSPDLSGTIVTMIRETSPIRSIASQQSISTDALEGDLDLDEAGTGGWVSETASRSGDTSTPQIGGWRIEVHEQYAEPRVTQKVLDDSQINVDSWLIAKVADKFARTENTAFVLGDGAGKPRGFMTYPAGVPAPGSWAQIEQVKSGDAALVKPDGLIDLVFSLKPAYRQGAVFGMNRLTQRDVRKLKDGQNNYLWQPDFTKLGQATLLGFPIVDMADLDDIGAGNLPIVFGDFRAAYLIVDRAGISVLRDPYTTKGRVKFYTTKRVGGGCVNFEALKIQVIGA